MVANLQIKSFEVNFWNYQLVDEIAILFRQHDFFTWKVTLSQKLLFAIITLSATLHFSLK